MFILWIVRKKFFHVKKGYSTETMTIRPEDLMTELGIKKSKYYQVISQLEIKADRDSSNKSYLTDEQANRVRAYLLDDETSEENTDSNNSSMVKIDDSNEIVSNNNESEEDIYINREEPTAKINSNLVREAEELAARGMAMNDLIKIQLASQMSFDDLSPDLQEKVNIAREVANPKFTPADIAQQLLAQHRSNRVRS